MHVSECPVYSCVTCFPSTACVWKLWWVRFGLKSVIEKVARQHTGWKNDQATGKRRIWDELHAHLHSRPALLGAQSVLDQSDQSSRAEHARWAEREQWERMLASLHETQPADQTWPASADCAVFDMPHVCLRCVYVTVWVCVCVYVIYEHDKDSRVGFSAGRSGQWATRERNEHNSHKNCTKKNKQTNKWTNKRQAHVAWLLWLLWYWFWDDVDWQNYFSCWQTDIYICFKKRKDPVWTSEHSGLCFEYIYICIVQGVVNYLHLHVLHCIHGMSVCVFF